MQTITFISFLDILMFVQTLHLLLVKQCTINTGKHGIYDLPYELPNRIYHLLRILGNEKILRKSLNFIK